MITAFSKVMTISVTTGLSCEEPGSIEHGTVTAIGDLMYESYVEYDCEDSKHDLVGWHLRRCDATGENTYWQGAAPQCKGKT